MVGDEQRTVNCFDFLRLFAALSVVVQHHVLFLRAPFLWLEPDGPPLWFADGVPLFFILSGYFVFRSADRLHAARGPWREFYRNRVLRIAPAIYLYLMITIILVVAVGAVPISSLASPRGLGWAGSTLVLAPVYNPGFLRGFGTGVINGSLWTIPVEVSFYLGVPLLVTAAAILRRYFTAVLVAMAVVAAGVDLALIDTRAGNYLRITCLPYLLFFSLGILWYLYGAKVRLDWRLAALAVVTYAALRSAQTEGRSGAILTLAAALPLSYAAMWFGANGPAALGRFTARLGDISFGTYIWHMIMINLVIWWRVPERTGVRGSALGLVVVVASLSAGWLSWQLVERPALRLKKTSSRRSVAPDPGVLNADPDKQRRALEDEVAEAVHMASPASAHEAADRLSDEQQRAGPAVQ